MLRSLHKLSGCRLRAADGDLGRPRNWLLDNCYWAVRYLVADTGFWPRRHRLLVPPSAFGEIDEAVADFSLTGTRSSLQAHSPVETVGIELWSHDLDDSHDLGHAWHEGIAHKSRAAVETEIQDAGTSTREHGDPHVCGLHEVLGSRVRAGDEELGRISDLIAEDHTWTIPYLVMDAGHWWSDKKLVVLPDWIESVDWHKALLHLKVAKQLIYDAPRFVPSRSFKPEYEAELFAIYYGQPV